ncbi:uncharacterized protein LOC111694813 isoform X2 [Eurytemora carolleeae]|uniref:uncharacterized protein LOC111694813 isoform X2 n=1 Tax=Eurytemora carolleeae TaxID=1294199 RepID=UPI000C773C52|nr:uncharacterized protein LOC111694813 isoform X2 [Eurytemora carolleeae]|eukprot:XP_023319610.1 uncharacterized protein LOC111694813 isoform X2 [Eurytemora affinis]
MWKKKGEIILRSQPYSSLLLNEFNHIRCCFCFLPFNTGPRRKCRKEGCVYNGEYCSVTCANSDKLHSLECDLLANAGELMEDFTHFILRTWLKQNQEDDITSEIVPGRNKPRTFEEFLTHEADLTNNTKKMGHILDHYKILQNYLMDDGPSLNEFIQLYGRIVINDFALWDETGETYG